MDKDSKKGIQMNLVLENQDMILQFDKEAGIITSFKMKKDTLKTEFIGNKENTSYPSIHALNQWMGDVRLRIWDNKNHCWREELTSCSGDVRNVTETDGQVAVCYQTPSKAEKGISSVTLKQRWEMKEDGLHWMMTVGNPSEEALEIGEVSLAFLTNADFTGIFEDPRYKDMEHWRGIKQKLWHEQRVFQHLSIDGHSSYAFLQRPKGDYPALLFQTLDDTKIEAAYQMDKQIGYQWALTFEGPYYLALYSRGAKKCEGWKFETEQQKYGMNGNTSLILKPKEEKQFCFVFHAIYKNEDVKEYIYQEGQLDVDVQPSMAVPVEVPVQIRLRCKDRPEIIPAANNMTITEEKKEGDCYFYQLFFTEPGQKKIVVHHGKKQTVLLFYAIDHVKKLLDNHAQFIVHRQYYENPRDPFGRHHAFLPYDDSVEMLFTESEESWQVGALDEYALPVAMYTAEKNSIRPNKYEIQILEEYIEDCLYGTLQQRDTYYARRGMVYEEKTLSDFYFGGKWDKKEAESNLRSFNYPLITDIYYAMYKIGKKFNLTKVRTKEQYLEMAYHTAMTGYELGRNKFNGAPAGATIVELLKDLQKEKPEWYEKLNKKISFIADENAESSYPFGSELYVDQTPHNQYEAMMRYYEKTDRYEEMYRVTYTLRNGMQPQWFLYGNEKRGNVCCWYGTPLNSRVLYNGFEYTGDEKMLKLGFAGLFSFLTCIRSNGAAHGWYLWWPDRDGFDFRSLDTDMGMYGYLYSAKSYVIDDEIFGRCGYGCQIQSEGRTETIIPYDGLGIRFGLIPYGIEVESHLGCVEKIVLDFETKCIKIEMESLEKPDFQLQITAKEDWTVMVSDETVTAEAGKKTVIRGKSR